MIEETTVLDWKGNLQGSEARKAFLIAGNAYFTIASCKSGLRFTYA